MTKSGTDALAFIRKRKKELSSDPKSAAPFEALEDGFAKLQELRTEVGIIGLSDAVVRRINNAVDQVEFAVAEALGIY